MTIDAKAILKRHDRLLAEHLLWRPIWQDIADFIHPRRSAFITKKTSGAKQTERLFDSTALDANERLGSTLNGTLTSRAAKWFSLKTRDEELNEDQEVQQWLEECAKRMFQAFNQSNFESEVHETYLDIGSLGTGAIFEEERNAKSPEFTGLVFRALSLTDYVIDEDAEGRVNTLFRTFTLSAAAALQKWTRKNMGEAVLKAFDEGKPDEQFGFLQAVFPRQIDGQDYPGLGSFSTTLPFACVYIGIKDKNLIKETGYYEFPFMVPRWAKTSGEKYGRGPGHLALPDVKTLNKAKELGLKGWEKAINLPTKSLDDGVKGPIRNTPGGNTVVTDMENIAPMFPPGTFREAITNDQLKSSELQSSIRRIFFADQMELPAGPPMTAFEVAKRFELLERLLGPTMGRQETELLNPLIERTFNLMFRKGAFSPAPQILTQNGAQIDVQYEGPLARSQRLSEVEGIERLGQQITAIAQLQPEVISVIDFDEAVRISASVLGVPAKIIRDAKQVQKIRDAQAQQNAQRQQMVDAQNIAAAAGKAAPALKLLTPGGQSGAAA